MEVGIELDGTDELDVLSRHEVEVFVGVLVHLLRLLLRAEEVPVNVLSEGRVELLAAPLEPLLRLELLQAGSRSLEGSVDVLVGRSGSQRSDGCVVDSVKSTQVLFEARGASDLLCEALHVLG